MAAQGIGGGGRQMSVLEAFSQRAGHIVRRHISIRITSITSSCVISFGAIAAHVSHGAAVTPQEQFAANGCLVGIARTIQQPCCCGSIRCGCTTIRSKEAGMNGLLRQVAIGDVIIDPGDDIHADIGGSQTVQELREFRHGFVFTLRVSTYTAARTGTRTVADSAVTGGQQPTRDEDAGDGVSTVQPGDPGDVIEQHLEGECGMGVGRVGHFQPAQYHHRPANIAISTNDGWRRQ
mmetsp:Transcript_10379/g.11856  ORF Transcript_10379/g.11856 Transcript_10379/m.11856 type:complete len:235 (+) Transcript_10379:255-959(+)